MCYVIQGCDFPKVILQANHLCDTAKMNTPNLELHAKSRNAREKNKFRKIPFLVKIIPEEEEKPLRSYLLSKKIRM
jgi:hypothetical protein